MKIWKKLLLGTAAFTSVVSVPVLLTSCGATDSDEYSSASADVETHEMVTSGTNDRTMSDSQKSAQNERFNSAKSELSYLKSSNLYNTEHAFQIGFKLGTNQNTVTKVSNISSQFKSEALKIESNNTFTDTTEGSTNYDQTYYDFWNKVAAEYKTLNIGYLFVSKEQFLSSYKESYLSYLSSNIFDSTELDTTNDNQTYSVFISYYLRLASLKEELFTYAYYKKMGPLYPGVSPLINLSKSSVEKQYRYFTHNIKKEVNGLWSIAEYAFA